MTKILYIIVLLIIHQLCCCGCYQNITFFREYYKMNVDEYVVIKFPNIDCAYIDDNYYCIDWGSNLIYSYKINVSLPSIF